MIPIGPILWLVVWLASSRFKKNAPVGATPAPGSLTLRSLFLLMLYLPPILICSAGILALAVHLAERSQGPSDLWAPLFSALAFATAMVVPFGGVYVLPRWLAWRVLRPLGSSTLARIAFWFAPFAGSVRRAGFGRIVRASLGEALSAEAEQPVRTQFRRWFGNRYKPAPVLPPAPVDPWTVCALALLAERAGDPSGADRLLGALALAAPEKRLRPALLVRTYAFELLAWRALERGDWEAAGWRASQARGRGAWLLRALTRAHPAPVGRWRLVLLALLAAERRRSFAFLAAPQPVAAVEGAPQTSAGSSHLAAPLRVHAGLLAQASLGRAPQAATLGALVRTLDARLTSAEEARYRARGLELGARAAADSWQSLRRELLEELGSVGSATPLASQLRGSPLGDELLARAHATLLARIESCSARFTSGTALGLESPAHELLRWLDFRQALAQLEALGDPELYASAWWGGVRTAVWDWPAKLFNLHGARAAWACALMFDQAVVLAERLGDQEVARVNRENAKLVRAHVVR